jgi:hypothetical protein
MPHIHTKYTSTSIIVAVIALLFVSTTLFVVADDINNQVAVGNAAPTASGVTNSNVTLTENTTTWATTSVTATDANGCSGITLVSMDVFRSGIGSSSCDSVGEADDNNCYPRITCTATTTGNTCTGGADTSAEYDCAVNLQYFADATDAGGGYPGEIWDAYVSVTDGTATGTASSTFEITSLTALDVSPALLDYNSVPAGTDTGSTNSTTTVTNTGNVDMDPQLSGLQLESGGDTIAVNQQEYSATPFTYGGGTDLTGTPTTLNITLPQRTGAVVEDDISWGIGVPGGTPNGTYTGTSTFTATAGI